MSDRRGLPSASGFHRLLRCAGSYALEQSVPHTPELPDATRESGTLIHLALAGKLPEGTALTPEQEDTHRRCLDIEMTAVRRIFGDQTAENFAEQRLWLHDEETLQPILSGQFDRAYKVGRVGLVPDYKTGWQGCEDAENNAQGMVYAVLFALHFDCDEVYFLPIQPNVAASRVPAHYGMAELLAAEALIRRTIREAQKEDAPRVPGDHCKFCRAKNACTEYKGLFEAVQIYGRSGVPMSIAQKARFFHAWKELEPLFKQITSELKATDPAVLEQHGLSLKEGNTVGNIDLHTAWPLLHAAGYTAEEVMGACKVSKGSLEKLHHERANKTGKLSLAKAEKELETILGPAIEWKKNEASLERV